MIAYIVTEGNYSDYHICAVFSSKEQAQNYVDMHSLFSSYTSYDIEEYEIDEMLQTNYLFVTYDYRSNRIIAIEKSLTKDEPNCHYVFQFCIEKSSRVIDEKTGLLKKDILLKIAQDEYAMYKTQKEGIV